VIPRPDLGLDGEPELVFQPAVDLATGRLLGFEALLRWNDPELGPISPSVLIPWAEANGHMIALNAWVLSEACSLAARWKSDLQLAVNCSVFQLRQREAAAAAAAALEDSGLNPDRLTIEITETTVSDDVAADELHAMSRLGIQLTVDDIGSDWSTLENLQQFSINTMKIDGSLIEGLEHVGGVNRAIVETIVRVSHSLGICTVAEGVETEGQVAILRELGADVGQGYFFAAPLGGDEAQELTEREPPPVFYLGAQPVVEEAPDDHAMALAEIDLDGVDFDALLAEAGEEAGTVTGSVDGGTEASAADGEAVSPKKERANAKAKRKRAAEVAVDGAAEEETDADGADDDAPPVEGSPLVSRRGKLLTGFRRGRPS